MWTAFRRACRYWALPSMSQRTQSVQALYTWGGIKREGRPGSKRAQIKVGWSATHLRLTQNLQTVLTDELQQLAVRQAEELLLFGYLGYRDTSGHTGTAAWTENKRVTLTSNSEDAPPPTSLKCVLM